VNGLPPLAHPATTGSSLQTVAPMRPARPTPVQLPTSNSLTSSSKPVVRVSPMSSDTSSKGTTNGEWSLLQTQTPADNIMCTHFLWFHWLFFTVLNPFSTDCEVGRFTAFRYSAWTETSFRWIVLIMFTPARDFLLETPWRIIIPNPNVQQSFPLILITKKSVNLSSCVLAKPNQLLSIIICLFKR
jgi:hypothetical protein